MSQAGNIGASGETGAPQRPRPQTWPEAWMRALLDLGSVSAERHDVVLSDIQTGSQPTATLRARTDVLVTDRQYQAVGDVHPSDEDDGGRRPER
jgi:hypothetical protein